jgi:putative colanic acid biosynthesis UDP-glucose lipid carrier transferase
MIGQRTRGLQGALLFCQIMLVPVSLLLSGLVVFTSLTSVDGTLASHYPMYALVVMIGLVFESMSRDRARVRQNLWQHTFLDQHRVTARQVAHGIGLLLVYLAATKDQVISRWFLLVFGSSLYLGMLGVNYWLPGILARRIFGGKWVERTLLVGSDANAERIQGWLRHKEAYGLRAAGILRTDLGRPSKLPSFHCLGGVGDLEQVVRREAITQVIVLELPQELPQHRQLVGILEKLGVRLLILSNLEQLLEHPVVHIEDEGMRFITLREEPLENPLNRLAKRALDLAVALPVVTLILPPLMVVIWIVQRFQSPGSLFFVQRRAGIQNREFQIIKFRTMHKDNPDEARQAVPGDERVYSFGRWMRRLSIDELPQFINVLKGEMSVTGPRPHLVEHNAQFAEQMNNYHIRTFVKPGITGLAQVRGFRGEVSSPREIARRLESDISYLENWRLALDISIIMRTAWQMLAPPKKAC